MAHFFESLNYANRNRNFRLSTDPTKQRECIFFFLVVGHSKLGISFSLIKVWLVKRVYFVVPVVVVAVVVVVVVGGGGGVC